MTTRRNSTILSRALGLFAAAAVATSAHAASPLLGTIVPRGAQNGTEIDVTITGQRLHDAQEVMLYEPGITVTNLKVTNDTTVKAHLKLAADAALGEHHVRVRCASGISELRTFWVGPYP